MNEKKKGFNLFPEYVWMIFVGMLLAILFLTNVLPAKAWTEDDEYVIIDDWLNDRLIKVTSDDDGNVFHPGVPTVKAVSEFVNGHWSPLPANNYLPNNFSVNGNLASCVLAPPSSWADDDHYRVIQPSWEAIYSIGIPAISVLDDDYYAYFEGGDGLIYAVVSDKPIYLKNKDSRGSFGVYSILPDPDASFTVIYQWTGSWNRFGYTSFTDTSASDMIAISTLFYGKLYWEDFEYTESVLGVPVTRKTDNYALYNGTLPRLDILSSSFDAPVDIPVDPEPVSITYYFKFSAADYYGDHYYMVSFEASNLGSYFSAPADDFTVNYIANENSFDPSSFSGTAFVFRSGTGPSWYQQPTYEKPALAFYFTSSGYSNFKIYSIPNATAYEYEPEVIAQTYTPTDVGSSGYIRTFDYSYSGVSCFLFSQELMANNNYRYNSYTLGNVYGFDYTYQDIYSTVSWANENGTYYRLLQGLANKVNFAYYGLYGLLGQLEDIDNPNGPTPIPEPTSTPVPTATPEPTPSATPIPSPGGTIYVVTPLPPTPPIGFQPYDPGSVQFPALGVQQFENITDQLSDRVNNTTAAASLGFLGFLMGFLPAEALWFLWFLLFILVVLAIVRLFIHFTGG